jgi:anti-sigma B factor antagonist
MLPVRFEERRGALVVTPLAGRLDADVAPEFRDAVCASAAGRPLVVVSLEHVRSMDASGLAALVAVLKAMPPGGELRLARVSPRVQALLAVTHLDELFPADASAGGADAT